MLRRETHGVLKIVDGRLRVVTQGPNRKKTKTHDVKPGLLRPAMAVADQLDGAEVTVVWNVGEGRMEEIKLKVPEGSGPVPLARSDHFLNPYAFVSLPDDRPTGLNEDDAEPAGHDRYDQDRWTGTVEITITTRTPLLLPDHARAAASGDDVLPVRLDHQGRPLLAGSAVKGALRSAYEAITNSRFGVFGDHDLPLAIRGRADNTVAKLRPAWVSSVDSNGITLKVVTGLEPTGKLDTLDKEGMLLAAWVPRHVACRNGCHRSRCRKPGGRHCAEPRGKRVEAWIYLAKLGQTPLWRVATYAEPGRLPGRSAVTPPNPKSVPEPVAGYPMVRVLGRLHWNGATFPPGGDRKHDERMVVEEVLEGPARVQHDEVVLTVEQVAAWEAVIDSYHRAREHDRTPPIKYGDYVVDPKRWRTLLPGDTLHVEVDADGRIIGLYPAMVGRKPFPGSPRASLPATHRPAESMSELSPADRVFGWVRQGADRAGVAYRGHLRVLPPEGRGAPGRDSVKTFKRPVSLAILGTPKPAQFRFYLGHASGKALGKVKKAPSEGYPAEPGQRRLRGRKVYLTQGEVLHGQSGADDYWNPDGGPKQPVEVAGHRRYREYLLAGPSANSKLVTRISGWVEPDTTFRFTLHVDNLTRLELAALLWLLELPSDASLKLGLGKPLGFGAVKVGVAWDNTRLFHGDRLLDRYRVISARPAAEPTMNLKKLVDEYDCLLQQEMPQLRNEFLTAARGFTGLPVHYPRVNQQPTLKSFEWFVENDRVSGKRLPLGELADPGNLPLPYSTVQSRGERGSRPRGRSSPPLESSEPSQSRRPSKRRRRSR